MANEQLNDRDVTAKEAERIVPIRQADGTLVEGHLPPINDILIPSTTTKSALIRWLFALGYQVKEIYPFLGVKYQMVRNITTNVPKRAAREDLPPLEVSYRPETDVLDDAMDAALEQSLMQGRKERIKTAAQARRESGASEDQGEND